MSEVFVINEPTCMRHGVPIRNCACGGHGNGSSDAKAQPIPIVDINYADPMSVDPMIGENEAEEVRVLDPWVPEYDDDTVVNANERPTPMPIVELDYAEIAKQP